MYAYAEYARNNPKMMRIAAVAEPDDVKRKKIQADHRIPDGRAIEKGSAAFTRVFMICHVLKYTAFFSKIKELLDAGRIGRLAGAPCESLSSYGALHYFNAKNAPPGAPERCI
jgi:hypothetical protein